MSSTDILAFAGSQDEAARTSANNSVGSLGTTPTIQDSVHLHLCSFQDMNSMALSASGVSAMTSSTSTFAGQLPHPVRTICASGPCLPRALQERCREAHESPRR